MININHDQFRRSAQTKKDAARDLVSGNSKYPVPAVYLAHVALECAIKLRILRKNGAVHLEQLRTRLPEETFKALFNGSTGHDLHHLATTAAIGRHLAASGNEAMLKQPEWAEMAGNRPFSLRYGAESVSDASAKRQVAFAAKLAELIIHAI